MGLESNLECQVCHTFWYGRVRPSEVLWKPFPKRGTASHATTVMIGHIGSYLLCTAGLSSLRPSEKGFCAVKPVQSKSIPESHLFSSWTLFVWCLDYFSWFAIFKFKTAFQFKSVNLWKSVRFQWEISIEIGFPEISKAKTEQWRLRQAGEMVFAGLPENQLRER